MGPRLISRGGCRPRKACNSRRFRGLWRAWPGLGQLLDTGRPSVGSKTGRIRPILELRARPGPPFTTVALALQLPKNSGLGSTGSTW